MKGTMKQALSAVLAAALAIGALAALPAGAYAEIQTVHTDYALAEVSKFEIIDRQMQPQAPSIIGPTTIILEECYASGPDDIFTVGGWPVPTVTVVGNPSITWNNVTKKIDVAPGLAPGYYQFDLRASNGLFPDYIWSCALVVKDVVCAIIGAGPFRKNIGYNSLDAALCAVPSGEQMPTTIRLYKNIEYTNTLVIDNKKITFDLNGNNLIINGKMLVMNNSVVGYAEPGEFKVKYNVTGEINNIGYMALDVIGGSICTIKGVEIIDKGYGNCRSMNALFCSNSIVVVNGDVIAQNKNGSVANNIGIIASNSTVIVNGNVKSPVTGAYAVNAGVVTINGTLTAAPSKYVNIGGGDNCFKTINDITSPTTKPWYNTYTDGLNTVWVKIMVTQSDKYSIIKSLPDIAQSSN